MMDPLCMFSMGFLKARYALSKSTWAEGLLNV